MATIRIETLVDAPADRIWDATRDYGALHTRLVPGFVVDTKLEGDSRIVTFGNGMVARERIVGIADVLPDAVAQIMEPMMRPGTDVLKATLEAAAR